MSFKTLHVGDLHLGQRFHSQDRGEDEDHALEQIAALCGQEAIDLVILAGDVFDTANPGAAEVSRYHRFLAHLVLTHGVGTVVVIAGNHDNASRIEGPRTLLEQCRIHCVGSLRLHDPVNKCLIPIRNRSGEVVGTCAAVPYLRDSDVRKPTPGEDRQQAAYAHQNAIADRLTAIHKAADQDLPLIVVGHAFLTNSQLAGDERPVQVGNLGQIPANAFAGPAVYLAMGHLHRPQIVDGKEHWRYAGSLLPTGFDEIDGHRSVVSFTVADNAAHDIQEVPLARYRDYQDIHGDTHAVMQAVAALPLAEQPTPWVRITVHTESVPAGLAQQLTDLAQARGWQALAVRIHTQAQSKPDTDHNTMPRAANHDVLNHPDQVFARLLQEQGIDPADQQALQQAFAAVQENCDRLLEGGH